MRLPFRPPSSDLLTEKPLALGTTAQTKDKSKRLMATIISNDYLNYLKG